MSSGEITQVFFGAGASDAFHIIGRRKPHEQQAIGMRIKDRRELAPIQIPFPYPNEYRPQGNFGAYLAQGLQKEMHHAVQQYYSARKEHILWILGTPFTDGQLTWVDLNHLVDPPVEVQRTATPLSVDIPAPMAAKMSALVDEIQQEHPLRKRVAWGHSHPNLGVFYSGTDRENQAQMLSQYAVGIVHDPFRDTWAAFRGPESIPMTFGKDIFVIPVSLYARIEHTLPGSMIFPYHSAVAESYTR